MIPSNSYGPSSPAEIILSTELGVNLSTIKCVSQASPNFDMFKNLFFIFLLMPVGTQGTMCWIELTDPR